MARLAVLGDSIAARDLASRLAMPVAAVEDALQAELLLRWRDHRLELAPPGARHGVCVDFLAPQWRRRATAADLAVRAVTGRSREPLRVIDATAGLGRDALAFAWRGHQVLMLEASPVVAALLEDGLQRAACSDEAPMQQAISRLSLRVGDARQLLQQLGGEADVVYLDPMFSRDKGDTALPGKAMQWLHRLLEDDYMNEAALLDAACQAAVRRVVVKRGRKAPPLARRAPSYTLQGRSVRFDVYVRG